MCAGATGGNESRARTARNPHDAPHIKTFDARFEMLACIRKSLNKNDARLAAIAPPPPPYRDLRTPDLRG
ncbi:hypothetical protein [Paraburkholderia sp. J94]|uniref:hypothetical protein n=1 Tax=Paraburkholderia sp. J94 TaxID=2805441 RepID=UPI002AAF3979|nr:hypothetical protein [Paraburkholderia sp. J94]